MLIPDSQPNASQIAYDVESGMTVAASSDAPSSPTPKSRPACCPARGASDFAASAAVSTVMPAGKSTWPATTTMKSAFTPVRIAPSMTSTRAYAYCSASTPLSTIEAWM